MNADLKRVRDSSLDPSPSSSKRRALGGPSSPSSPSSSHAAGAASGEGDDGLEDWMRVVESKRKEAIYRQMLDYRRNCEREAARANALERQRQSLELNLRSVEACWQQLVNSVREQTGRPDDAPEGDAFNAPIDPCQSADELDGVLKSKLAATLRLVSLFADAAAGKPSSSLGGELHQQLVKLQAESSTLRLNSNQLQSQIDQLRASRDSHLHDLQRAERRLDRQRMEFDKERAEWRNLRESSATVKPVANGSGHSTPNARASEAPASEPAAAADGPAPVSGGVATSSDTEERAAELEKLSESRLKQLESLRADHTLLSQEVDKLKQLSRNPSETALRESPFFQVYLQQLAQQTARAEALQQRFDAAEQKLDQLRDNNLDFREAVLGEARAEVEALRPQLSKKDTDLARLRGQRDEYGAELAERKARDSEKARYADEMEALCNARQERINYLASEVKRLRGTLAARDGAESYLAFLRSEGDVDVDYIKSLEQQLASAKAQVDALSSASGEGTASEASIRAELEEARRSLAKHERVFGPDASEDVAQLSARLQKEAEAKSKLELQLADAEETTNSLYAELEGVTKLWEGLDQTLRTKVFELKDGELRMQRLSTEKAKADNKYFQAMRSKEAVDVECKTAQRSVEKQLKLLERAREVEKALTAQISQQDKSLTIAKNSSLDLQSQLATATSEKRQIELRLQQSQAALAEAQQLAHTRVAEASTERAARGKIQDELEATQRQLTKLKEKQEALTATSAATNTSAADLTIREEREKLLKILRCSCCEINFKQQVIVKCMHTFCKDCLDQRIASRQRKCPACGLAFAKEDCQTLYWQ